MLRKRIIFSLIYNDGFFTQSRNFRLQKVGNLHWLEKNYQFQKIAFSLDELIVLNASRDNKSITEFAFMISQLVKDVFIPICAGGGIRSMEDAELLFRSGADKIIVNSILLGNPVLVKEIIQQYGSQSLVASVDYKTVNAVNEVFISDGTKKIEQDLEEYLAYIESLDIGEIYLNSIDKDGTGFGYDFPTIQSIAKKIKKPLIIAGGAGNEKHLVEGLNIKEVSAVATANLFNFIGDGIPNARAKVLEAGLNIVDWRKK
jgi:cyclase